jgi:acyl-CoA synthetase (AMP-forming)/AMP-acid ligase II
VATDPLTLPALLRQNSELSGGTLAIISDRGSITHAELDRESAQLARRMIATGAGKSSRIGLVMENGIEWAVLATAAMRIGAVLVPLSTLLKPPELHSQLRVAAVREYFSDAVASGDA